MAEMTVREAVGILSAVDQQSRAARCLGEALKIGLAIEGIVNTKTAEAEALDIEITKKKEEDHSLYREYKSKTRIINKLVEDEKVVKERILEAEIISKKALAGLKKKEEEAFKKWKKDYAIRIKALEEKIQEKREKLSSVEVKIYTAEAALNKIKEKLG